MDQLKKRTRRQPSIKLSVNILSSFLVMNILGIHEKTKYLHNLYKI